jgi:RNA polymerase sigma factor (sigma-70 family)
MPDKRPIDPRDTMTPTLVASLRDGGARSGELLDHIYGEKLVRFCIGYVGNPTEAEDVVQDVFYKVLRNDEVPENFRAWIYRICRNRCLDVLRARGRRRDDQELLTNAPYHADLTGQLTRLAREERHDKLRLLLEKMPPAQSEVLRLRYSEGLSRAEIAEVLEIQESVVKSRLYEGLERLRRHDSLVNDG